MKVFSKTMVTALAISLSACGKPASTANENKSSAADPSVKAVQAEQVNAPKVSRDPEINAAPLGLEIGYANLGGVKQKIGSMTTFKDAGIDEYSGGVVLVSDGQGLGIDGLTRFDAIFDNSEQLVLIKMTFRDIEGLYSKLSAKYKPIENKESIMGRNARLEKGDTWVIIEELPLSISSVLYTTKSYIATAISKSADAKAKKEQEQKNKL